MEVFQILDILFLSLGVGLFKFSRKNYSASIQLNAYQDQVKEKLNSKLAVMNLRF